ncbi:hypothetical protein J6590_097534, partial [Homalodisca vitripennis]
FFDFSFTSMGGRKHSRVVGGKLTTRENVFLNFGLVAYLPYKEPISIRNVCLSALANIVNR